MSFQDPSRVLQAYLRATYARDFAGAYRYISTADRKLRDLDRYMHQRGSFNGFASENARKLSEAIASELVRREESADRIQLVAKYQVPDPKRLSSWLLNPVTARIGHLVEPSAITYYLDFVQCGFLLPVTIAPAKEKRFSGTYLLRAAFPTACVNSVSPTTSAC